MMNGFFTMEAIIGSIKLWKDWFHRVERGRLGKKVYDLLNTRVASEFNNL
jgi:hypothetical protein